MRFFPWQSRTAKQNEKRDGLDVPSVGLSNLSAIWNFLDGGSRFNESDEVVTDASSLSISTVSERAATWKPEDLDSIAAQKLQKVTKTLTLAAHRSVAEHVALKGLPNGA
jgi:hypothetical protein